MVRVVRRTIILALAMLLLTGCGSFWEDQGTAAVTSASARRAQAEAARENARAAIIDAEARGAMAESQADALRQSVDAVVNLADDGEYVGMFAAIAFAVLAFAGWTIWATHRHPAMPAPPPPARRVAVIEAGGQRLQLEQAADETPAMFVWRVEEIAARMEANEQSREVARWDPEGR